MLFVTRHYIYQIRCRQTDRRYVGSTSSFPGNQWGAHWTLLRNSKHRSVRFQEEWDSHPSIVDWEFTVLEVLEGRRDRRVLQQVEARYITSVDDTLRLNMPNRTTLSVEKHVQVERLLKEKVRYVDIQAQIGLSLGMISKIRQRMNVEHRKDFLPDKPE